MPSPPYWFRAKRYGWGWGLPITWQGWVVLLVWVGVFLPVNLYLASAEHPLFFLVFDPVMVLLLILVCLLKGEPARWRWGDRT